MALKIKYESKNKCIIYNTKSAKTITLLQVRRIRMNDTQRIIKEFQFDKKTQSLMHPYVKAKTKYSGSLDIYNVIST